MSIVSQIAVVLVNIVTSSDVRQINWLVILNSIHKQHKNPLDKGANFVILKWQIATKASNDCHDAFRYKCANNYSQRRG